MVTVSICGYEAKVIWSKFYKSGGLFMSQKIRPFFYLVLGRSEKGGLYFNIYDISETEVFSWFDISNENGLLKYDDRTEELNCYVSELVEDIAEVFGRFHNIFISFDGDISDADLIENAINEYNRKESDKVKPELIYVETDGNFSLKDLINKINVLLNGANEKIEETQQYIASRKINIESQMIRTKNNLGKNKISPEKIAEIKKWYKSTSHYHQTSFFRDVTTIYSEPKESFVPTNDMFSHYALIISPYVNNNNDREVLKDYLEDKTDKCDWFNETEVDNITAEENQISIPVVKNDIKNVSVFEIREDIKQSEFLDYTKTNLEVIKSIKDKYVNQIIDYNNSIDNGRTILNEEMQRKRLTFIAKTNEQIQARVDAFDKDIVKTKERFLGVPKNCISYTQGDEIEKKVLFSYVDVIASLVVSMKDRYCMRCFDLLNKMNENIHNDIENNIKIAAPGHSTQKYNESKYDFIDSSIRSQINDLKNKIPDRKSIKDRLLEFGITHKNKDFGVEEKKKNGKYVIYDKDKFISEVYYCCFNGNVFLTTSKVKDSINDRKNKVFSKIIDSIVRDFPTVERAQDMQEANEKIKMQNEEKNKINELICHLVFCEKEIANIEKKYKNNSKEAR